MGVNKAILLGSLGKDPELRYTPQQMPVCSFSLATSERRKDASGNWTDHTEWHNIITFGKTAENCAQYLKKGRQAYIEGRIQTRKWQDREGRDRWTTEIVASTVQFVGGQRSAANGSNITSSEEEDAGRDLVNSLPSADSLGATQLQAGSGSQSVSLEDDDIPF